VRRSMRRRRENSNLIRFFDLRWCIRLQYLIVARLPPPPPPATVSPRVSFFLREQTTSEFINPFLLLPLPPPSPRCAPVRLKGAHRTSTMESTAHHGNGRLSKYQEDIIVGVVQALSTNNLPLSKMKIREAGANR